MTKQRLPDTISGTLIREAARRFVHAPGTEVPSRDMQNQFYTVLAIGIFVNGMTFAAQVPVGASTNSIGIVRPEALNLLNDWKAKYIPTKVLDLRYYTRSSPTTNGTFRIEFAEKYSFEWPSRMKETHYRRPFISTNTTLVPSQGPLDNSWSHWFSQCINANAQCINVKPEGKYTLFEGPMSLSESASSWLRVSPWLCAQCLNSTNYDELEIASENSGFIVRSRGQNWAMIFHIEADGPILLTQVDNLDNTGRVIDSTKFSEYVVWPTLEFKLPRTYVRSRLSIATGTDGELKLGDSLQLKSESELIYVESTVASKDVAFEIDIPQGLEAAQFERVASPQIDELGAKLLSPALSRPSDNGSNSTTPSSSYRWNSWLLWTAAGILAILVAFTINRRVLR
ncbi:MAG: hypothetical protein ACREJD_15445 [Phycisphaerales bacterium]